MDDTKSRIEAQLKGVAAHQIKAWAERRAAIFNMYEAGHSFREVGEAFGISTGRAHQIYHREAGRLRRKRSSPLSEPLHIDDVF